MTKSIWNYNFFEAVRNVSIYDMLSIPVKSERVINFENPSKCETSSDNSSKGGDSDDSENKKPKYKSYLQMVREE